MDEYLDIANEKDEVVGRDTRENVHGKSKIHREVHVFIINPSTKEILVQKRSENVDYKPGYYDVSVGAHVLSRESYKQSAIRECKEELGFDPEKMERVFDYKSYSDRQRVNRRLFVCYSYGPFRINKEEVESVRFNSPANIQKDIETGRMKFTEGFKISFRHYLEFVKGNAKA